MSVLEELVFRISMRAHKGHPKINVSHRPETFSADKYDEWREHGSVSLIERFFDWNVMRGKRVLEFGCGTGPLSHLCASHGAARVIGVDLSERNITRAREIHKAAECPIEFIAEKDPTKISLPDASIDVIICFDVMEHVMEYEAIIREWRRVLAPDGCILIWWSVWWHPYGHHCHTMIPVPWVHVFLSDRAIFRVAARIYDSPEFQPRFWHFDSEGRRKKNPYAPQTNFNDLNKLTIRKFDEVVARSGLRARRKQINPFTGRRLAWLKRWLAKSPWPDFFCASVVYEIDRASL